MRAERHGQEPYCQYQRDERKAYERQLLKLCHLQEWVKAKGLRAIVVFEGRDAAGKGGPRRAGEAVYCAH
jgi:polyphosphate kinase 2 (PPK2 family)